MNIKNILIGSVMLLCIIGCDTSKSTEKTEKENTPKEILSEKDQLIFNMLKAKDSLLFQVGFNKIDTTQVALLTSDNFEFYHDEHGITTTKQQFVNNIQSLQELPFKTWRTLDENSLEVFPLYKNNSQNLYGAIQKGTHYFYQQNEGEKARKTNTAKFVHVWIIENAQWKLRRVLSFDHQVPEKQE
ncbi:nuclear transport factor 2 family protein [Kordia sp.]|uniref:nuclear transport factor 2 family protein n=1 Tax=Kordia sp. TaxID=1965332 RepID=UPI003B59971B